MEKSFLEKRGGGKRGGGKFKKRGGTIFSRGTAHSKIRHLHKSLKSLAFIKGNEIRHMGK